jgi:ABC-type dipeptide/oligopeptide/nickel transport system permease subunit
VKDWAETDTLVLLALLIGIALGSVSGYYTHLDEPIYRIDNDIRLPSKAR